MLATFQTVKGKSIPGVGVVSVMINVIVVYGCKKKREPTGIGMGSEMRSRSGRKKGIVRVMVGSLPFGKMSSE